ncbi:MAG TPA: D-Ala-D-Ala carboxypeptidase family metallohydrolase [Thermoanaerobaculia bacterium]|nr:D-Ala-D-Ala carboxypeptidase family metallohydrolase [Thermoanaerobaculia bacterium]
MLSVLVAALLALARPALAETPDPKLPARFRDIGGLSGKLLAFIETREGLAELERAGLRVTIEEPGVYPFEWPPGWPPAHTKAGASVILLTPFSAKRDGRIGAYILGSWPNEDGREPSSPGAKYASTRAAYAVPPGFIKVTKATSATRVSEHFRLGDFLTKDQASVWPKYLVLDLKLVDKLELLIAALGEAGHPVKGIHVMSGFRTPRYNAREVGKGHRSAVSRHIYGDAADVYPDDDGNGRIDDLNGDGCVDPLDARIVAEAAESVEKEYPELVGGISVYPATAAHGPVVHVDTRGTRARW